MKSISAKKLKKLGGKMPFSSIQKRTKPKRGKAAIVRRRRTKREFARIYGSKARVKWVQSLPCLLCENTPSQNAHIETGGTGRKADYDKIVPLCYWAHRLLHTMGRSTFERCEKIDLAYHAAATQRQWEELQ